MPTEIKRRRISQAKQFARIERISVAGVTERMGPHGLHMYADAYLSAALALPQPNVPFEPVRAISRLSRHRARIKGISVMPGYKNGRLGGKPIRP